MTDAHKGQLIYFRDGYATSQGLDGYYRRMTLEEAKMLVPGTVHQFADDVGSVRNVRVNGKPRAWKTRPDEVRVPLKYGIYEYGYDTADTSGEMFSLLVFVKPHQEPHCPTSDNGNKKEASDEE